MSKNYPELLNELAPYLKDCRSNSPDVINSFFNVKNSALKEGVLDEKTKTLIALAIAVAVRCEPCLAHYTKALIELGGTKQELMEMLNVAILMGGGPSVMYAAEALKAFNQFSS